VIFAAKEAVEKRAMEKGRKAGIQEGREEGREEGEQAEQERIMRELEKNGVAVPPEVARILTLDSGDRS
jgi:predicted transposase YdaD